MASIQGFTDQQNAQLAGAQIGQLIFIQKFNTSSLGEESDDEQDDDFDEDAEDDADEEDDSEADDEDESSSHDGELSSSEHADDEDDESDAEDTDDTSLEEVTAFLPTMYIVAAVSKDEHDSITDLRITSLAYADKVGGTHTYHIYGTRCESHHSINCDTNCKESTSIKEIADTEGFSFSVSPHGDLIRRHIATNPTRQCITNCRNGFLDSINSLPHMVKDYDAPTLSWDGELPGYLQAPVCPACMGPDLLKQQQDLQLNLLNIGPLNSFTLFGDIHEYHQALARRWSALGLPYKQFDEREWGHNFTDMLSDEDDDEYDEDGDRFEQWDEALDPNSNPALRPASDATIEELPRKLFKDVAQSFETTTCMVCQDTLQDETVMVELPCGHVEFCEECIVKWLKNYDNCPKCRAKVPSVGGEEAEATTQASAPVSAPIRRHVAGPDHFSSINGLGMSGDDAIAAAIAASMAGAAPPQAPAPQATAAAQADAPAIAQGEASEWDTQAEMDSDDAVMSDW